jgi:ribosomal-protein-alanine N-acetyltransferase
MQRYCGSERPAPRQGQSRTEDNFKVYPGHDTSMGHQGRFGKYGETKRFARLRQSGMRQHIGRACEARPWPGGSASVKPHERRNRVHVRQALPSDEGFVTRLSGKVFNVYGPYRGMIRRWLDLDTAITFIALQEGKPVGFAMLGTIESDLTIPAVTEILAIAVRPDTQRMGIGQLLLREVEKKAASMGEERLFLHTATGNIAAQRLFMKNAYRPLETKRNFYPKGQDALMMVKEIDSSP